MPDAHAWLGLSESAYGKWRYIARAVSALDLYKNGMKKQFLFGLVIMAALAAGCTSMKSPLQPVARVDLPRYMGDWYVIANIPYFAEKGCVDSIESYALRPDGNIDNWFTCRKKSFSAPMKRKANALAVVDDPSKNSEWHVKFFKVISVKYVILDLDPGYQWAVVGHPSRNYGWVLARSKTLSDGVYQKALKILAAQGYDTNRFEKVPQQPTASPAN